MATEKWAGLADRGNILATELNSLASGSRSNVGTEYDNSTNKDCWGQLEFVLTFASAPSAIDPYVLVYMVNSLDGTTYEDGSNTVDPGAHKLIDRIPVRAVVGPQILHSRLFTLKSAKTKFMVLNGSGQALAASGSYVKLYTDNRAIA